MPWFLLLAFGIGVGILGGILGLWLGVWNLMRLAKALDKSDKKQSLDNQKQKSDRKNPF